MENRSLSQNKKAFHNYHISDKLEVGVVLVGTEVKSIRAGKIHLDEAYVIEKKGELYLQNASISLYDHGNRFNHTENRLRKLLAKKEEIIKLGIKVNQKGFTLLPLKMYFKGRHIKLEIGLGKHKDKGDKRQDILKASAKREIDRALKNKNR